MDTSAQTVLSAGAQLAVYRRGDPAAPTVLLVHGRSDTHDAWEAVSRRLESRFHTVSFDVRGSGASAAPPGRKGYRIAALAADISAVAEAVSPETPVHLVGHGWGSVQAWEAVTAACAEHRIASFTSISGLGVDHVGSWIRRRIFRPTPRRLRQLLGQALRSWRLIRTPHRLRAAGKARHSSGEKRRTPLPLRDVATRLARPRSRFTAAPVQLIMPARDPRLTPALGEDLAQWAPRLWRRTVDATDWHPRRRPEDVAAAVSQFVDHACGAAEAPPLAVCRVAPKPTNDKRRRFAGRLVVVTGAGSGIGRAATLAFAAEGAEVIACDLDPASAELTAELADRLGARARPCRVDVADEADMEKLASTVLADHGVPDVLVNNAGIGHCGPFLHTSAQRWREVLDVNVWGVIHGSRIFGQVMADRGRGGQIVNVASAAAYMPSKIMSVYSTSKAAVLMLSECLRAELSGARIGVTAVCPGFVNTSFTRAATFAGVDAAGQETKRARLTGMYFSRGFGPEKVARAIVAAARRNPAVKTVTVEARAARLLSRLCPAALRLGAKADPS